MAISKKIKEKDIKNKIKNKITTQKYEDREDLKKVSLYISIVNKGNSQAIVNLFKKIGSSAQFVQLGEGTAIKEIRDIFGIDDTGKEIILSFIKKDDVEIATKELDAFFVASKANQGIGFALPLTSIVGVKIYQFLTNTDF